MLSKNIIISIYHQAADDVRSYCNMTILVQGPPQKRLLAQLNCFQPQRNSLRIGRQSTYERLGSAKETHALPEIAGRAFSSLHFVMNELV